jgi:hypothetical protein
MARRTLVALVIGALSVACAAGAFDTSVVQYPLTVEPNPDATDQSVIQGFVLDQNTGERVPDALVILQCSCLQGPRETQAGPDGLYRFRHLPPGKYTVQVLFGEANLSRSLDLTPGTRVRADFRLDSSKRFVIT